AVGHPLLRINQLPVLILIARALQRFGKRLRQPHPRALVSFLEGKALGIRPIAENHGLAPASDGTEDIGARQDPVAHLDRVVPIDAHAVADFGFHRMHVLCRWQRDPTPRWVSRKSARPSLQAFFFYSCAKMTTSFDTIIIGGGAAGCVLANRLSARSAHSLLLIQAAQDPPPGQEPADILDSYPTSYYNDAYFWPGLKVHWRRRDNSPAISFSQGRIMGGGSSVMGMVAYRGTPDDYSEWEAHGAEGWGWEDVLPFYRKLEHDLDF